MNIICNTDHYKNFTDFSFLDRLFARLHHVSLACPVCSIPAPISLLYTHINRSFFRHYSIKMPFASESISRLHTKAPFIDFGCIFCAASSPACSHLNCHEIIVNLASQLFFHSNKLKNIALIVLLCFTLSNVRDRCAGTIPHWIHNSPIQIIARQKMDERKKTKPAVGQRSSDFEFTWLH